ncbi:hypothetical protein L0Y41_02330 [bacterium]|nr:hypothetical protein [bacterium]
MKGLTVKLFETNELPEFQTYVGEAYHEKYILKDPRYIEWQFDGICIARTEEKIVGHLGFKDVSYKIYDETKKVRVLMNLFTLPSWRIFGVGALIAKKVMETEYPVFVSGYTDATAKLIPRIRDAFRDAGNLTRYMAVFDPDVPVLREYTVPHVVSGEKNVSDVIEAQNGFTFYDAWKKVRERFPVTVERTDDYLSWRFFENPFLKYRAVITKEAGNVAGYLIFRIEEAEGFHIARIVDMAGLENSDAALLHAFIGAAKRGGAHAADFFCSGFLYRKAIFDAGFFGIAGTAFEDFPSRFSPLSRKKTFINVGHDLGAALQDSYFTKADGDQDRANPH